jgi:hypothetical protein
MSKAGPGDAGVNLRYALIVILLILLSDVYSPNLWALECADLFGTGILIWTLFVELSNIVVSDFRTRQKPGGMNNLACHYFQPVL